MEGQMTSGRRDGDRRVTTYEFARFYFLAIQGPFHYVPSCGSYTRCLRDLPIAEHPVRLRWHCQLIDKIPNKWVKHLTIDLLTPCVLGHERQGKSQKIGYLPLS